MRGLAVCLLGVVCLGCGLAQAQEGGLLVPQWRGEGTASVVTFSPDGGMLAAGTVRGELLIFDSKSLLEKGRVTGLPETPVLASWSADGSRLYSLFSGKDSALWVQHNAVNGAKQQEVELNLAIRSAALEPSGRRLLMVETGSTQETVWYLTDGLTRGETVKVPDGFQTNVVTISADGMRFALGAKDGRVALFKKDGRLESEFQCSPDGEVSSLAFSPKGDRIACGNLAKKVYVYSVGKPPALQFTVFADGKVTSVVFPHQGPGIFVGAEGTGGYYDEKGNIERAFSDPNNEYQPAALVFATDSYGRIAMGMANDDIAFLESRESKKYQTLGTTTFLRLTGRISANGVTAFFLAALGGNVGALNLTKGTLHKPWAKDVEYFPEGFTLAPDGESVATRDRTSEYRIYTVSKGNLLGEPYAGNQILAISHDGKSLVSVNDMEGKLYLGDTRGDGASKPLLDAVASVGLFSEDDKVVYVAFEDGSVAGFDTVSGKESVRWKGEGAPTCMVSGPAGSLLIARGPNRVVLADAKAGTEKLVVQFQGEIGRISGSPDGRFVLAASQGGHIVLWDVGATKEAWSFDIEGAHVEDVGFTASSSRALVACDDGTVRYLSVQTGIVVAVAKFFEEGAWFFGTSAGYYTGSKGVEQHFAIRDEGVLKPLASVAAKYRDAKKVRAVLK